MADSISIAAEFESAETPTALAAGAAAAGAGTRDLVYVHGICRHDAGYSDLWRAAMKPFVADVLPEPSDRTPPELLGLVSVGPAPVTVSGLAPKSARGVDKLFNVE